MANIKFCPSCASNEISCNGKKGINGGDIFVAEEMEGSTEYYAEVEEYDCKVCETTFFVMN